MTFSREARINGVASPLFNVFVCLHPCHTPRGRGAGARTNGGSVRPARPAASGPKQTQTKRQRHVPESIARMCARAAFPDCPVDRTLPRRDGDLTKRTQKGLWNSIRGFLVPPPACCLPWICHYIMTFFSYYRRPAESGGLAYLHPPNLNVARVSLTCFPRATCTMRLRGVGRAKPAPCCVVLPPQCLS